MAQGKTKAHYMAQGAALHAAGLLIFWSSPRSWQHKAKRDGYLQARDVWRKANPKINEWDAAKARNEAFCKNAFKKPA